jgi:hypothetical protein
MPQYICLWFYFVGSGAMLLFWLSWLFAKGKIAFDSHAAAFFGVAFNMLTFQGLSLTSPIGICNNGDHPNDCTRSFGHYHERTYAKHGDRDYFRIDRNGISYIIRPFHW